MDKKKKIILVNIVIMFGAILFTLFLVEVFARITVIVSTGHTRCSFYSTSDDVLLCRFGYDSRIAMAKYNQTTLRSDEDICDMYDSELGWIPKPNCHSGKYKTNSQGMRGTKEFSVEKNNKTRIIFLGDSFTWGEDVFDNETYPFYLGQLLPDEFEVMNLGVHGYGPDQFLLYLKRALKYEPDVVIVGLFVPDIHRTTKRFRDYFKPRFIFLDNRLILEPCPIPNVEDAYEGAVELRSKRRLYSISLLQRYTTDTYKMITGYKQDVFMTKQIIKDMKKISGKTRFIILLIPTKQMIEGTNADYYGVVPELVQFFNDENIEYIDITPKLQEFNRKTNETLYKGHFSPFGNKLVALIVYEYLNGGGYNYNMLQPDWIYKKLLKYGLIPI